MISRAWVTRFTTSLTIVASVVILIPFYTLLHEFVGNEDTSQDVNVETTAVSLDRTSDSQYIQPSPADGGTLASEEKRLVRMFTEIQATCNHIQLPGQPKKTPTKEREELRGTSYVCIEGKKGLKKQDCLVYAFGIMHREWFKFPELVEKEFGCNVYVFDPALDFIDHYYSKKIRFSNARLSDIDQQAQYRVAGEKGWKYRKFLTLIKENHFTDKLIDVVRLDVTLDLWRGVSTMLKDGSLRTFVKQLTFEYDLNRKNATEIRQMFGIAQWLKRQGFLLVHSQPTKLSGKSYALTYVNNRINFACSEKVV